MAFVHCDAAVASWVDAALHPHKNSECTLRGRHVQIAVLYAVLGAVPCWQRFQMAGLAGFSVVALRGSSTMRDYL